MLWLGASSSCSENSSPDSDRTPPTGQEDEDTPTGEDSEDPREPGSSDNEAPEAIPLEVIANNPAHNSEGQPALRSLASGKLEQRLARGLRLNRKTMCKEMGGYDCFGPAFLAALGNSQPRSRVLDQRAVNLPTLAPVALERIARHVCQKRISLDQQLGDKAEVFRALPLSSTKLKAADAPTAAHVREQTQILYRRLLGRSATNEELVVANSVLDHQLSGIEVARSLCFAIAGSMEVLLGPQR